MDPTTTNPDRGWHRVKQNEQSRIPHRWMVFDTETRRRKVNKGEVQSWRCAVGVRWRDDLKTSDREEWFTPANPREWWEWVAEWCHPRGRTVLWAHNLAFDLRISQAFTILPELGFRLVWWNLSRDASVVKWEGPTGSLLMTDTHTWLPTSLEQIGSDLGMRKPALPKDDDSEAAWLARCRADVAITQAAVKGIIGMVRDLDLGNWQASGAGQAFSAWRHRFMHHETHVHSDQTALDAERAGMHTGRAEAFRHGEVPGGPFTVWDVHMSYCRIAAQESLPRRLYGVTEAPTLAQYDKAGRWWSRLVDVDVTVDEPVVPCRHAGRIVWPVGSFRTVLWDHELALVREVGRVDRIHRMWRYRADPILADWANWTMTVADPSEQRYGPIARRWAKHTSRALIGRMAVRYSTWEPYGDNPLGLTGTALWHDQATGVTTTAAYIGDQTLMAGPLAEGDDSLPQITSAVMSIARVRLWRAMQAAGPGNVVYADTDSVVTTPAGDAAMAAYADAHPELGWRRKDTWRRLTAFGPRMIETDQGRFTSGVPKSAKRTGPGKYRGDVWESLGVALASGHVSTVHIAERKWQIKAGDPRREDAGGGYTTPIRLGGGACQQDLSVPLGYTA